MKARALVFALLLGGSLAQAATQTVIDAQGRVHGTGYIGPQAKLLNGEKKVYWAPTLDEIADAPVKYDSRNDGGANYVAGIRDQGQCGSCWDFSMTKTLESARMASGLDELDLAEQDPLTNDRGAYGCDGGFMDASYWINHGLASEADCPYKANDRVSCNKPVADKGLNWGFVGAEGRAPTEDELVAAIYKYKVISITVAAGGSDWNGGNGGRMTACRSTGINHMVNLVGYDCSSTARQDLLGDDRPILGAAKKCVFIGANSWGDTFGDNGFFYAQQGCNQMASTVDSALFITYKDPTPPPPPPPPPPPGDLPHPMLPLEVFVGAGDELHLGTRGEQGTTYQWSTGDTEPMIFVTPAGDKVIELKATNAKGTTTVKTAVRVLPKKAAK